MKKSILARGFIGSVASLLGVMAVGCGADTGWEGAAGEGDEIGSVAEALTVNVASSPALQFSGWTKLTDSKVLIAGGYTSAGAVSNKIGIYDHSTNTFTQLRNATDTADMLLPAAVGEPEVAPVPGQSNVFVVVGGRTSLDGAASPDTYVVTLNQSSVLHRAKIVTVESGGGKNGTPLATERVLGVKNLKPCGTGSRLIAFGGMLDKGLRAISGQSATDTIEVFTYVATNDGADSDWAPLSDGASHNVIMRSARGYAQVFDVDQTNHDEFFIAGGMTSGATAVTDVDKLTVSASCVATNAQNVSGVFKTVAATALPQARARAASILVSTEEDSPVANTTYEGLLAGGNNTGNTRPRDAYALDIAGNSGLGQWFTYSNAMQVGAIFPVFVRDSATTVKLATGLIPESGNEAANPYYNTSAEVDGFTESTTSGAWAAQTDLTDSRVGAPLERLINGTPATVNLVMFGAKHSNTAGIASLSPSPSTPASVVEF